MVILKHFFRAGFQCRQVIPRCPVCNDDDPREHFAIDSPSCVSVRGWNFAWLDVEWTPRLHQFSQNCTQIRHRRGCSSLKCSAAWLSIVNFSRRRSRRNRETDLVSSEIMIGPLQYKRTRKKEEEIMHVALSCVCDYQHFSEASGNRQRFVGFVDNWGQRS